VSVVTAGIAPHPPIIVPEVGRGEQKKATRTIEAMQVLAQRLADVHGETIIIITPHGPMYRDAIAILNDAHLQGDFANFLVPDVKLTAENDPELVRAIWEESRKAGVEVALLGGDGGNGGGGGDGAAVTRQEFDLDHGITVPLYYLQKAGTGSRLIAITYAPFSYRELFKFGRAIKAAVERLSRRVVVIASSDLSHRLIRGAPAGYDPRGEEFDRLLVTYLESYQAEKILNMDTGLIRAAGECGLRSIAVLLGCLDDEEVAAEVLSYEGPFGVGYPVAIFIPQRKGQGDVE
jgi:aromatic ring-opening dioxygenase LigB subunit